MAGMYEKLGDLLNETLEAGHVKFVHIEREEAPAEAADSQQAQNAAGPDQVAGGQEAADIPHSDSQNADSQNADSQNADQQKAADYAESFYQAETEAEHRYFKTSQDGNRNRSGTGRAGNRRVIYRRVTPELEKAFSLLVSLDSFLISSSDFVTVMNLDDCTASTRSFSSASSKSLFEIK